MSVWHHFYMTALAKDKAAVKKFFNFDDDRDVVGYGDRFEISFGGNYGPSLNMRKILQNNPDLIFLIKETIECDTTIWFLSRYDSKTSEIKNIRIQDTGSFETAFNKKILEDYEKHLPGLAAKHFANEKGFETFRWKSLFNDFDECAIYLDKAEEYKEMIHPSTLEDLELEQAGVDYEEGLQ